MARGRRSSVQGLSALASAPEVPTFRVSPEILSDIRLGYRTAIIRHGRREFSPGSRIELYTFPRDFSVFEVVESIVKPLSEFTDEEARLDGHADAEAFRTAIASRFHKPPPLSSEFTLIRLTWR